LNEQRIARDVVDSLEDKDESHTDREPTVAVGSAKRKSRATDTDDEHLTSHQQSGLNDSKSFDTLFEDYVRRMDDVLLKAYAALSDDDEDEEDVGMKPLP